jgi:hypothetical protein
VIDFAAARKLVADAGEVRSVFPAGDFMVGEYGWESDTEFRIVAGTRKDVTGEGDSGSLTFDAPTILVDKTSGAVRLVYWHRLIDANPAAGMTPIGVSPVD